jgi:hypothetical protein
LVFEYYITNSEAGDLLKCILRVQAAGFLFDESVGISCKYPEFTFDGTEGIPKSDG